MAHHQRRPLRPRRRNLVRRRADMAGIEVVGRLVEQDQVSVTRQRGPQHQQLVFATRQAIDAHVQLFGEPGRRRKAPGVHDGKQFAPDMFNFARQVRAATDHAANTAARLSGKEAPKYANDEASIAQLKERLWRFTIDSEPCPARLDLF